MLEALQQNSVWEPHVVFSLVRLFSKPSLRCTAFVDYGARLGLHTLAAARLPNCCCALAIERHGDARLRRNVSLNPDVAANVRIVPDNGLRQSVDDNEDTDVCRTLDDVVEASLEPDTKVGVLRLDVEHQELETLQGAQETLRRWR